MNFYWSFRTTRRHSEAAWLLPSPARASSSTLLYVGLAARAFGAPLEVAAIAPRRALADGATFVAMRYRAFCCRGC
jgi:hypothetical protein